jgi:hypothetical protein
VPQYENGGLLFRVEDSHGHGVSADSDAPDRFVLSEDLISVGTRPALGEYGEV